MKISISTLYTTVTTAIKTFGYTDSEAAMIADVLLYSELRGKDQGVIKLINPGIPKHENQTEIAWCKPNNTSTQVDVGLHHPMIVMHKAVELCAAQAQQIGMSMTSVINTTSSSGCLGFFAEKLAREGLVAIMVASSTTPMVTVPGGKQKLFGTNPIAYAFPTQENPIVADFATSAISLFGVRQAHLMDKALPENVAVNRDGEATCNPEEAMDGALLTFGQHKGALLSLLVELLAGCLGGAGFPGGPKKSVNSGHFMIAIKPDIYMEADHYFRGITSLIDTLKHASVDEKNAFIPGRRGSVRQQEVVASGFIHIDDNLWEKIQTLVA